jgi:VanZ family protein
MALMPAVWFWDDKVAGLNWFESVDKWLHGITFMVLSVWFAGLYQRKAYWKIALGLLVFGFLIEACQRLVSYRSAEMFDVGADAAGIILGLLISLAGIGGWGLRVEQRLTKH